MHPSKVLFLYIYIYILLYIYIYTLQNGFVLNIWSLITGGDMSLPPKLEPSDSVLLLKNSDSPCEPPTLKPIEPSHEKCPKKVKFDRETFSTSLLNGLSSDVMPSENNVMVATSTLTEPANMVNRRTAVLFRKSKSPQKPSNTSKSSIDCPQLGTKTFLSVVIPRLEPCSSAGRGRAVLAATVRVTRMSVHQTLGYW